MFDAWDLGQIIRYIESHGLRIEIKDGRATLHRGRADSDCLAKLAPHLRARRKDVIDHYSGKRPYRTYQERLVMARRARARMANLLMCECVKEGIKLYSLVVVPHCPEYGRILPYKGNMSDFLAKVKKGKDGVWIPLPPLPKSGGQDAEPAKAPETTPASALPETS